MTVVLDNLTDCASSLKSFQESSESAAGQLLSNCVSEGVVTEEEVASLQDSVLSSHLYETDKHVKATQELDQLRLQVELLRLEQKSADVAHRFHLIRRFQEIQMFNEHLQQVLKNHKKLRERLMQPVTGNKLPIPSHLHRSVVEVFDLMLEFIVNLEDKLSSTHAQESINEHQSLLYRSVDQLSFIGVQTENLANQLLEGKISAHHCLH
ncbi:HAUS augmin-like complex subunit 2 isoform X2 [Salarias fasciatus]|uniref:HAUS augmin-like complex subunit 2 isoform X2 n=1 Tax=Salarias fasciatus TaxID=181472 RepID=UPI001176A421|nr:HAUS augmin-like complex subunit 2 isoform X2 [Salarias fasciatus]